MDDYSYSLGSTTTEKKGVSDSLKVESSALLLYIRLTREDLTSVSTASVTHGSVNHDVCISYTSSTYHGVIKHCNTP